MFARDENDYHKQKSQFSIFNITPKEWERRGEEYAKYGAGKNPRNNGHQVGREELFERDAAGTRAYEDYPVEEVDKFCDEYGKSRAQPEVSIKRGQNAVCDLFCK